MAEKFFLISSAIHVRQIHQIYNAEVVLCKNYATYFRTFSCLRDEHSFCQP